MHQRFTRSLVLLTILFTFTNTSQAFLFASGAPKVGYGSIETENKTTIPKTQMAIYGMDVNAGLKFWGLLLGVGGEYSLYKQITKPADVSNVNSQGTLKTLAPIVGFDIFRFRLIGKFITPFIADYTLDKKNSSGKEVIYKDPKITSIQLHYKLSRFTFFGAEYQGLKFKKEDQGGSESTISDTRKPNFESYALLLGLYF